MAYQGSTAASSVSNPPVQIIQTLSQGGFSTAVSTGINMGSTQIGSTLFSVLGRALGGNLWYYASTDQSSAVFASGYFADGFKLGMRPGDILFCVFCSSLGSSQTLAIGLIGDVSSTAFTAGALSTNAWLSSTR